MAEFLTVADAKTEGLIPEAFFPYINDCCPCCGESMYISRSRTNLKCNNAKCVRKVAFQADGLFKDLGIKGFGPTSLETYCESINAKSIIDVITDPPPPYNLVEAIQALNPTFPQIVELLHIPNFGTKAYKLFDGFDSFKEFLSKMSASGDYVNFILNRVGGEETTAAIVNIMTTYRNELLQITDLVRVRPKSKKVVLIQITGHILNVRDGDGGPLTKDEYVRILNDVGSKIGYEFRRSDALKSVEFIVADTASKTRKYLIGQERGVLVSSDKLLQGMSKLAGGSNGDS